MKRDLKVWGKGITEKSFHFLSGAVNLVSSGGSLTFDS